MEKSADAFRTISEVADDLSMPQHVLRFWETRFPQVRPLKRAGGRRYYRPADVLLLRTIRQLLYDDGYTIKGVQRLLKEQGTKSLNAAAGYAAAGDAAYSSEALIFEDAADDPKMDADMLAPTTIALRESDFLASGADRAVLSEALRSSIRAALADVEECERLLAAVRRPVRGA